jgi:hypothetical protein
MPPTQSVAVAKNVGKESTSSDSVHEEQSKSSEHLEGPSPFDAFPEDLTDQSAYDLIPGFREGAFEFVLGRIPTNPPPLIR